MHLASSDDGAQGGPRLRLSMLQIPRRVALGATSCLLLASTDPPAYSLSPASPPLSPRLDAASLTPLSALGVASQAGELRYPAWLLGNWRVTNTISAFTMVSAEMVCPDSSRHAHADTKHIAQLLLAMRQPLGEAFVDGFTRAVAEDDVAQALPLQYNLRFVAADAPPADERLSVAQDRRFNAIEETNSFLGSDGGYVRECVYESSPAASPHGRLLLEVVDPPDESGGGGRSASSISSQLTLSFDWVQWDFAASGAFVTSELVRQRTRRPASTYEEASDETSYLEILTSFSRVPASSATSSRPPRAGRPASNEQAANKSAGQPPAMTRVRVRNRIAQYLELDLAEPPATRNSPQRATIGSGSAPAAAKSRSRREAAATALAAGRATSFFDYDWIMERIDDEPAAAGGPPRRALGELGSPRYI